MQNKQSGMSPFILCPAKCNPVLSWLLPAAVWQYHHSVYLGSKLCGMQRGPNGKENNVWEVFVFWIFFLLYQIIIKLILTPLSWLGCLFIHDVWAKSSFDRRLVDNQKSNYSDYQSFKFSQAKKEKIKCLRNGAGDAKDIFRCSLGKTINR